MSTAVAPENASLLNALQTAIPLVDRPFAAIGQSIGLDESDVIARISSLKTGPTKIIRQISAIFDSASIGYRSSLVAAKVDPAKLEQTAAIISAHPGVSHNYERAHAYNLWYTVTVPPDSKLGLERTVDELHKASGAIITRLMPALHMYKIGVKFDLGADSAPSEAPQAGYRPGEGFVATPTDKLMIRSLQQDLPLTPRPFDQWAEVAGVSTKELLAAAQSYLDRRIMRRFSAVLHHRQAGFSANAMGAWIVPADSRADFGTRAAASPAVSHCYERPTFPDWPYSIFTMVHGKSKEECEGFLADISRATGVTSYTALYSTREFKKIRVKYFTPEIEAWEKQLLGE